MNIAVIAPLGHVPGEHENVVRLLEAGLPYYHLRKPGLTVSEMKVWVQKIPAKYHHRITLHAPITAALELKVGGMHLRESDRAGFSPGDLDAIIDRAETEGLRVSASVHSPAGALSISDKMLYVFLSPAFDSPSKPGLSGTIQDWNIPAHRPCKIYALGGVHVGNVVKVAEYGLDGVAVLGAVWHGEKSPLHNFTRIREACQQIVQPS